MRLSPPDPTIAAVAARRADAGGSGAGRTRHRLGVAWRMLSEDLRRWPFDLVVNVVLASPLVPRLVRVALLRALGMPLRNLDIYPGCRLRTTRLRVGKGTVINSDCHFDNDEWVEIGAFVGVGMNVTFITAGHQLGPRECRAGALALAPITVGDGSWIGANVVILPGVTIGDGCVVAAGSIVRSDCEPNGLYGGVPARRIDRRPGRAAEPTAVAAGSAS